MQEEGKTQRRYVGVIPSTVNILGKTFDVEMVKDLKDDDEPACGIVDFWAQKIRIDDAYSVECQQSTLLHEVIEAINALTEMGLKHRQISTLENCLYQVLRDNELF